MQRNRYRGERLGNGLIRVWDYQCAWAVTFEEQGGRAVHRSGGGISVAEAQREAQRVIDAGE